MQKTNILVAKVMMANKDYTTGRPYIEACKCGTQTLSCQDFTSIRITRSTVKNTHPPRSKSPDPARVTSRAVVGPAHPVVAGDGTASKERAEVVLRVSR